MEALSQIWAVDLIPGLSAPYIFAALFFATFVSEDAACIAAGSLAATGEISLALAITSCFAGIVVGDLGLYGIGRLMRTGLVRVRFVSDQSLARASAWLDRRGIFAVFVSRFVTGMRLPTYLAAGFAQTSFWKFAFYFVLAAAVWTPILVGGAALSANVFAGGIIFTAIAMLVLIRFGSRLTTRRSRRIMLGKLVRVVRWEFWPLAIFYLPVVLYVLLLGIRHRSLTLFTCANPAIPDGGFVGESKDRIYAMLASVDTNRRWLLKHRLISCTLSVEERLAGVVEFIEQNDLEFPVVIKPDAGERGSGVRIAETPDRLADLLSSIDRDHIVQEFCPGDEVGIFYYRLPDAPRGQSFSVTEKIFPAVTGDGTATLEELILRDDRAVCLAESYFRENADRLGYVPAAGEQVSIISIGTHARGAIFRDGRHLITAEFERAIDEISLRLDGFGFGRFDIRYSSLDELQRGSGFKIIELNGVTSESTNIYDPRYSLFDAYGILFRQWRLAFEIGAVNRDLGARPSSAGSLVRSSVSAIFTKS